MRWCWINVRKWRRGGCAKSAECIGPVPAPVYKVNDIYRKILYIKCEKCAILDQIRGQIETLAAADTKWQAVQIQYDIS
ncbi:MAG: hypothetical protein ACLR3S_06870 [Clostridium fessum]